MIIPKPQHYETRNCSYSLNSACQITTQSSIRHLAKYLQEKLATETQLTLPIASIGDTNSNDILLEIIDQSPEIDWEGYHLEISDLNINIRANDQIGIFHGIQSLLQLISNSPIHHDSISIAGCCIVDSPRFSWRGMHLDVSRHFFPVDDIKRFIDHLARYKFNRFHWHLCDDQGWRIESRVFPKLTEIGAWRIEANGSRYGGYYSQSDIKEIVQFATSRFIEIVPEIEMPGHATSSLAAYPEYSCTGSTISVATEWGIFDNVYCAGNDHTFTFLERLLDEVIDLFPNEFIHIGGDECPKTRWRECPLCQHRIKSEKLANEYELQSYFVKRIAAFLSQRGKRAIGWDEILEGGLATQAAVMSWRGFEGGIAAATMGHDVVMSPTRHCYFDYYQGNRETEPKAFPNDLPLEQVYAFEPVPAELSDIDRKHILGGQGNLWTEYMPDWRQVEYMLFPRVCAMSEVLWSQESNREFGDFKRRLVRHLPLLDRLGVNYRKMD